VYIEIKKVEIETPVSSGGQGKYVKYVRFPWPPLEAALSIFTVSLFFCSRTIFGERINNKKEHFHQC
jgi:hypothetical protein